MKYMNFLSSCSYAGLANLLEGVGVDTEDARIALAVRLPWLLEREAKEGEAETKSGQETGTRSGQETGEDGGSGQETEPKSEGYFGGIYRAGAMLQGERWFNRYLKPRGWQFVETMCGKEDLVDGLQEGAHSGSMLGLRVSGQSKHAVIFQEKREGKFVFLNNRRKESKEPEFLVLTREDCQKRLDDTVWVGRLAPCAKETVDFVPLLEASLENWEKWWGDFSGFAACRQAWDALCAARDKLFRAFLLDGLAVCGLVAGKEWGAYHAIAEKQQERLVCLQRQYLAVMQRKAAAVLKEEMDMELARRAVLGYQEMIQERLGEEKRGQFF